MRTRRGPVRRAGAAAATVRPPAPGRRPAAVHRSVSVWGVGDAHGRRRLLVVRLGADGDRAVLGRAGVGREAESSAREKMREWMGGMDFVGRDEFEAVKAMAAAARDENEALKARISALEAKAGAAGKSKAAPKVKPGASA